MVTTRRLPARVLTCLVTVLAMLLAAALGSMVTASPAAAVDASSPLVLSEVYGGGGNSGAPYTNDFVELVNFSDGPVTVDGWSVQYASAAGTSWQVTPLAGSVPAGGFYLVQEAAGAASPAPLPTPDASGTIAMSATSGKVALVRSTTALTCGASCSAADGVVDFVGYGSANDAAGGQPTPALSNTTSAQRKVSPPANTGVNAADFTVGAPSPAGSGTPGGGSPDCSTTPPAAQCVPGPDTIQDIQGDGFLSPKDGQSVERVAGIVTAVRSTGSSRGFWIQQPDPDARRPASSGLFVFTSAATVRVGDSVLVSGPVKDFYPLGTGESVATTPSLSTTEISGPTAVVTLGRGNPLPDPVLITPSTIPATYAATASAGGNIESIVTLDPARSAQEWWEAHEGMLVRVDDARVVGPGQQDFGEIYVTTKPAEQATPRGGTYLSGYDDLPAGRVLLAPVSGQVPAADVGDVLSGATAGPVEWSRFGGYSIAATTVGARQDKALARTVAPAQSGDQLAVATYNVENLAPSDPDAKFARLGAGVVDNLRSPDVIAVEEIQDDSGATDDGVVAADQTLTKLTTAITAARGPAYSVAQIDPVNDQDGGQPGGNIRSVFLYNPARVTLAPGAAGDSTTAVTVSRAADGTAALSLNPGRVDPANAAWTASRKPLAGQFVFQGRTVIVVANHFNSKGGDQSAEGRFQPPYRSSEVQRTQQAAVLHGFVAQVLAADQSANVVLAGDFNDYQFSGPVRTLTDDGATLTDLITTLPADQQYTYVFNGISQVLDHIFVTKAVSDVEYDVVHLNAEFADQVSDHDPQVVRLRPSVRQGTLTLVPASVAAGGSITARLSGWYPGRTFTVTLDGTPVGTVTTDGAGTTSLPVPVPAATTPGQHTVDASSPASGSASALLTVPPASVRLGSLDVIPRTVVAGLPALVVLQRWAPGVTVTLSLDGTARLGTVRTTATGLAATLVTIPAQTTRGAHRLVATASDGGHVAVPVLVLRPGLGSAQPAGPVAAATSG